MQALGYRGRIMEPTPHLVDVDVDVDGLLFQASARALVLQQLFFAGAANPGTLIPDDEASFWDGLADITLDLRRTIDQVHAVLAERSRRRA